VTIGQFKRPDAQMTIVLATIFAAFALNLWTCTIYPVPWLDEVMYTDPGIHLARGDGLTSGAWYNVYYGNFWFSNVPLPAILTAVWVKAFGDGLVAIRSLNYTLISGAAFLVWDSLRRWVPKGNPVLFITATGAFLFSESISTAYRSARPDAICILVSAALMRSAFLERRSIRLFALGALASIAPWAGLQLVVFTVLVLIICALKYRLVALSEICATIVGMSLGASTLLAFYLANDSLADFLISTVGSQHSSLGQFGQYMFLHDPRGTQRVMQAINDPVWFVSSDFSMAILVVLIVFVVVIDIRSPGIYGRSDIVVMCIVPFVVPYFIFAAGKYPTYYFWMGFSSSLILVWVNANVIVANKSLGVLRYAPCALLVMVGAVGLPLRLWEMSRYGDYPQMDAFVRDTVARGEWVYVSPEAYFSALDRASVVLSGGYVGSRLTPEIPDGQKSRISLIVTTPEREKEILGKVGGCWREVGKHFDNRPGDYEPLWIRGQRARIRLMVLGRSEAGCLPHLG
jgi:hypothetical protein